MNFEGRAVVTDPDCFGVGDVADLLDRDMQGKAIMAVPRPGHNRQADYVATSVMLLDNAPGSSTGSSTRTSTICSVTASTMSTGSS